MEEDNVIGKEKSERDDLYVIFTKIDLICNLLCNILSTQYHQLQCIFSNSHGTVVKFKPSPFLITLGLSLNQFKTVNHS